MTNHEPRITNHEPRITIFGYIGFSNLGDEAMLQALLQGLRERLAKVHLTVISNAPKETSHRQNVASIPRTDFSAICQTLRRTDLLIGCGGSLLQDATSFRSLLYYCGLIWLAKRSGCKVAMLGQGIGPLLRPLSQRLAARTLEQCDLVTLRDAASQEKLLALGVHTPLIELTADISFALELPPCTQERVGSASCASQKDEVTFGIALRPWQSFSQALLQSVSQAVMGLVSQAVRLPDYQTTRLLLLPFQRGTDEAFLQKLSAQLPPSTCELHPSFVPHEMLKAMSRCDLIIAMRLHALIFAAMVGIPFVAIAYDPKVQAFAETVDSRCCVALSELNAEMLAQCAGWVWEHREELKGKLLQLAADQHEKAQRNFELAGRLLERSVGGMAH